MSMVEVAWADRPCDSEPEQSASVQPASGSIARSTLLRAADLVAGERDRQHGSKRQNFQNIADQWNAYLGQRLVTLITPVDVGLMMALLKIARTKSGSHNPDDYIDGAGYLACSAEIIEGSH
jgi:hypothetical protein